MAPSRFELKPLLEFLKQEFREKRPKGIDLVLVKQRAILTRGALPEFQLRAYPGSRHLIVEDLGAEHRVYFFAENGIMAGGINVPTDSPWLAKLWKGSRVLYHLPKKEPEVRPEQAAETEYQRFVKVYTPLASLWGARPDPPLLQIMPLPQSPSTGLLLGAVEEEDIRRVSLKTVQSLDGFFILAREAFRSFVPIAGCFSGEKDTEVLVNFLATVYCGASVPSIFKQVWENTPLAPLIFRLPAVLKERSKQEIEKYIRAVAGATGLLGRIGENLSPASVEVFILTLITDFLEGRSGRNERLLLQYYINALQQSRNAKENSQGDLGELAVKAMLAFASFAHDLKLTSPPDVGGITSSSLLDATRFLLAGKYQPLVEHLNREAGQLSPPILALARMAIAAQIRAGGVRIEVDEMLPLAAGTTAALVVHIRNVTDLLLFNGDVSISPQPAGRLHVGDLQREGPVDLHANLLFRCAITGVTPGSASLEVRASMDHPCASEKRILLISRIPITIT